MASVLIVVFGFFFVTVSSRIVGLIGTSSNPISGMTIATLIVTCVIFVALGWTGDVYSAVALCVGAIVCIAAANAGATSQDLKTGYLVGATPIYQQYGLVIGVLVSSLFIGLTTLFLHQEMVIGSSALPAPQATLMATIIKGLLARTCRGVSCSSGVFLAVTLELCGIHALSFAVGAYLPISTTAPIFVGGLVRAWVERGTGQTQESEVSSGTLFASGLIAGGSLAGILYALLFGRGLIHDGEGSHLACIPFLHQGTGGLVAGILSVRRARGHSSDVDRTAQARVATGEPCAEPVLAWVRIVALAVALAQLVRPCSRCTGRRAPAGATRRTTTLTALATYPLFFHGQPVRVRATVREQNGLFSLEDGDTSVWLLAASGGQSAGLEDGERRRRQLPRRRPTRARTITRLTGEIGTLSQRILNRPIRGARRTARDRRRRDRNQPSPSVRRRSAISRSIRTATSIRKSPSSAASAGATCTATCRMRQARAAGTSSFSRPMRPSG